MTYPLATTMLSVPGLRVVRGSSFVGDSFVYVLFKGGTNLYWARSRVLEYLSQLQGRLPKGATASLGRPLTTHELLRQIRCQHSRKIYLADSIMSWL